LADVFDDVPDKVTSIEIASAAAIQSYNVTPLNRFKLVLDFSETLKFADYNAAAESTPNRSRIEVIGPDKSWAFGVYETILSFFRDNKRKRRRRWLHARELINLFRGLVALPAGIWVAYRIDSWLVSNWTDLHISCAAPCSCMQYCLALG
jgi:hypothetical protein